MTTTITTTEPVVDRPVETDDHYEVVDGRIVETAPMGAYEIELASLILEVLGPIVRERGLGRVISEMLFDLRPAVDQKRRPDVAYVSADRWPLDRRAPHEAAWAVIPDLAIEIVSPTNSAAEVLTKVQEYFTAGVRRVWVIYPEQTMVYDYASPTSISVLTADDNLDGGDLVPGFRLGLAGFFGVEAS